MPNLQMWGRRLLLRSPKDFEERTEGGLYLPEQVQERQHYRQWEVVAVGPAVQEQALLPGLRVLVSGQWVGEAIRWEDADYRVMLEEHVVAIL